MFLIWVELVTYTLKQLTKQVMLEYEEVADTWREE